ncbi:SDR family oxidoreductase [Lacrimispora sp. NSJ-141]|uniref:SDR family oxidoreductase n=1 Tax=Lientehia hominis TaxID=2897778 RepID=A0AAP2RL28_9FIRM|nr:SDR family oxidoreductase [Lientehia hominis]MCD2493653.1 SDR family oxidoreductase [Lientehia hominis]
MKLFDLTGKKAIVTGGSRGLGMGMAEGLMEAGAHTVIIGKSEKAVQTAEQFRKAGLNCDAVQADIQDPSDRKNAFVRSMEILGDLDILVNAAGITFRHPSAGYPRGSWEEILEVNLTAPFELSQMAAEVFFKKNYGKIINVSSMLAFFGATVAPAYAASKGGITQMSKSLCNEWASHGINVNCVAPGFMDTDMNDALTDPSTPRYKEISGRIPAGRWGTPEDMKGIAVFLASPASDYLNGTVIPIDGGYLVR